LEIALIKLGASEAREELQKQRLAEKDATIKALEDARDVRVDQIADLRTANKERATVNTGDARMLEAANGVIAKQDAEIAKLRNPGFLSSVFDMRTAYGGIFGYAACKLTTGSNPTISLPGFNQNSIFITSPEERTRKALRGK